MFYLEGDVPATDLHGSGRNDGDRPDKEHASAWSLYSPPVLWERDFSAETPQLSQT